MRLSRLAVFSDAELDRIHDASLRILAEVGMEVRSAKGLDLLASAGASADR